MANNAEYTRVVAAKRGTHGADHRGPGTNPRPSTEGHATRAAHRIQDGIEVAVDGNPAALVDLSQVGAQGLGDGAQAESARPASLGRRHGGGWNARVVLGARSRCRRARPTRYRAGIEFGAPDRPIASFCEKQQERLGARRLGRQCDRQNCLRQCPRLVTIARRTVRRVT